MNLYARYSKSGELLNLYNLDSIVKIDIKEQTIIFLQNIELTVSKEVMKEILGLLALYRLN